MEEDDASMREVEMTPEFAKHLALKKLAEQVEKDFAKTGLPVLTEEELKTLEQYDEERREEQRDE